MNNRGLGIAILIGIVLWAMKGKGIFTGITPPTGPGQTPPTVTQKPAKNMGLTEVQAEIDRLTDAMGEISRLTIQWGSGALAYVSAATQQVLREFPHDWDGEQYFSYVLLNRVAELRGRLYELQGTTPDNKWMPGNTPVPNMITVQGVQYPVIPAATPYVPPTVFVNGQTLYLIESSLGWKLYYIEPSTGEYELYPYVWRGALAIALAEVN